MTWDIPEYIHKIEQTIIGLVKFCSSTLAVVKRNFYTYLYLVYISSSFSIFFTIIWKILTAESEKKTGKNPRYAVSRYVVTRYAVTRFTNNRVFQKAEIARAASASAISPFEKLTSAN